MRLNMLLVTLLWTFVHHSSGAKILGLFVLNTKSHSLMINTILKELIARGHQLDVVTASPLPSSTPNYTAIDISPGFNYMPDIVQYSKLSSFYEMRDISLWVTKEIYRIIGYTTAKYALNHPNVQRLLHAGEDQHYDLILVEQFYQDPLLMFAHKFHAPIISISTFGWNTYFDSMFGSFGAWAHVPHELLVVTDHMTFWQRMQNMYFCLLDMYWRHFVYMPQMQSLADTHFAHLPGPHPSLEELGRNVSVMLQNSHSPLAFVKPNVPGIIDVGGIHIKPPNPLPGDLKQFLDEAQHGVIYFSLGTLTLSKDMPAAQLSAFQQVFNEFSKVKVLWKWESDKVDQMPANVLTKHWMPQNDILAHPNVKLFISHGGLFGNQEAIYHGVPMLGIPVIIDQHNNVNKAALQGYALRLLFSNVTVESLRWAITELMDNPVYAHRARELSRIFRDRPESAMDRAMYWIEYVVRFGGADHLRSAGRDLAWYSYFLLDIVAGIAVAFVVLLVATWFAIRRCRFNEECYERKSK